MCNVELQTQRLRPCWSGASGIVRKSALSARLANCMLIHKAVQTIFKPDRRQQDRSAAACVIAQQYSSATFVSLRHHYRKITKIQRAFANFILLFPKLRKSVSQYMNALRKSNSCGVWRRVVGRVFNVSKEFSVSIFRVSTQDSETEGTTSLRNVEDYQTTRRHNPNDLNLQEQCCENLKSRKTDS